ncbi:MAG: hypothetical protein MZU97_12050 [Bacillus subtilis]|nr:hypothetical protein [Bacillus subtilis]
MFFLSYGGSSLWAVLHRDRPDPGHIRAGGTTPEPNRSRPRPAAGGSCRRGEARPLPRRRAGGSVAQGRDDLLTRRALLPGPLRDRDVQQRHAHPVRRAQRARRGRAASASSRRPATSRRLPRRDAACPCTRWRRHSPVGASTSSAFTVGYELAATNILTVLDLAGIPLGRPQRGEGDPIVIAGRARRSPIPCRSRGFLDAVWIGEAEAGFFDLAEELARDEARGRPARQAILRAPSCGAGRLDARQEAPSVRVDDGFADTGVLGTIPLADHQARPGPRHRRDHARAARTAAVSATRATYYRPQRIRSPERSSEEVEALVLESRVTGRSPCPRCPPGIIPASSSLFAGSTADWRTAQGLVPAAVPEGGELHPRRSSRSWPRPAKAA